jgi:hypothetical protein
MPLTPEQRRAAERIRQWRAQPVRFARECLGAEPDAWQARAMDAVSPEGPTRLALSACAGPGKSALLAWLGWWWLACHAEKGEHPKGIAVAASADNLATNLWPELAKWRARSPFLSQAFEWQKERIFAKDHAETWFLQARAFARSADPQEQGRILSGLHSRFPLVLIDESGDMAPSVGRAAEQALGGCRRGLVAQAGNPTSQSGLLYDSCVTRRDAWSVVRITADPDDPERTPRVDIAWAREQIRLYGRENPWVQAYILGLFPSGAMDALLSAEQVAESWKRAPREADYAHAPGILGCDVARFGDDRTVIVRRQGNICWEPITMRGAATDVVAGRLATLATEHGAEAIFVDGTGGYGAGVVDALRRTRHAPIEVAFSGAPIDERFFNKRSEMWWLMAEWVKKSGALPPGCTELLPELTAPTYWLQNGKLRLEEKDQIKKRLGRSPDVADALALTFAHPVATARERVQRKQQASRPWSPFAVLGGT